MRAAPPMRAVSATPVRALTVGLALALALLATSTAIAEVATQSSGSRIERRLADSRSRLERIERGVASGVTEQSLDLLRGKIEAVRLATREIGRSAGDRAADVRGLLAALGPAPEADGSPEAASVAAERGRLGRELSRYEGWAKQAELLDARAAQLSGHVSERLRAAIAEELFQRGPPPLSWAVITRAGPHLLDMIRQLASAPIDAWTPVLAGKVNARRSGPLLVLMAITLALTLPLRRRVLARFTRDREVAAPSFARRFSTAVMIGVARGLLPALVAAAPLAWLMLAPFERGIFGDMIVAALGGIAFVALVSGVSRATLAPYSPTSWRMAALEDGAARALHRRVSALAVLCAVLFFVQFPARRHLVISAELVTFYDFVTTSLVALFILSLLSPRLWRRAAVDGEPVPVGSLGGRAGVLARLVVALVALAIPVTGLLGYARLPAFLVDSLLVSGLVVAAAVVLHALARDGSSLLIFSGARATTGTGDGGDDRSGRIFHFWLVAAVDVLLAGVAVVLLLRTWGVPWADIRAWTVGALGGIRIGGFTLSLSNLLGAIFILIVVLVATRAVQRLLEERIFPQTRLDSGMRNSLKTATGYVGLVIAVALAISALGLDLSNLAIIAGALSVGIGFGLQNVVNNFVSGLILLVERPLKVGDWVMVGEHQGYVRRINVRATEIETFQRAAVIIPNSELISSAVTNWTHRDTFARVEVAVGVAYGSDVERVRDLLVECARAHPRVNDWPAPFALFLNFGESSLDFELRCYIGEADQMVRVASELRFAVDRAFRDNGVEIPFPQRDLHLRSDFALEREARPSFRERLRRRRVDR